MAHVFAIVGASGHVGQALATALSKHAGDIHIKAVVRDPASPKTDSLRKLKGVELVKGDLSTPASVEAALRGVSRVYINTPGAENREQLTLNGLEAAEKAGAEHVVFVSVPNVGNDTLFVRQLAPVEARAKTLRVPYTIVQSTLFVDNHFADVASVKAQGTIYGPAEASQPYTPIVVEDLGAAIAHVLLDGPSKHGGKTYLVSGPAVTHEEIAKATGDAVGKPVQYVRVPYDAAKKAFMDLGIPEWQTDGILELYHVIDKGAYPAESPDLRALLGKSPTTFAQWVQANAAAFK